MRRFLFLLVVLSAGLCFAGDRSVVIAVDTSRSLSTENLQQISEKLSQDLTALPPEIMVGLIAFDDTARWITEPTLDREGLIRSLDQLKPTGNYTVLNDALFLAARKLEHGGIIILVSDGRDENSAVRVEDVQKLCTENHVAILSMASGSRLDARALRRLSMLSGGRFLGELDEVQPADFAAPITQTLAAQLQLEATPVPVEQPKIPPKPTKQDFQEAKPISPSPSHHLRRLLPIGMSVLILCLIGWFLFHKKGPVNETCSHCGCALEDGVCLNCEMKAVEEAARTDRVADAAAPGPPSLDPEALARETLPAGLDRTMSLGEVAVLIVREEGAPERTYSLPRDRIFAVGRAPGVNTLVMGDPTISSQHFKIVYREGLYYVVDLGTTNGTLVNSESIRVHRLNPGDTIRAGLTDFVFSFYGQSLP